MLATVFFIIITSEGVSFNLRRIFSPHIVDNFQLLQKLQRALKSSSTVNVWDLEFRQAISIRIAIRSTPGISMDLAAHQIMSYLR